METLVVLLVVLALAAFGIKYRMKLAKWLSDPNTDHPYRKKILKRRIEDDEAELAEMEKEST